MLLRFLAAAGLAAATPLARFPARFSAVDPPPPPPLAADAALPLLLGASSSDEDDDDDDETSSSSSASDAMTGVAASGVAAAADTAGVSGALLLSLPFPLAAGWLAKNGVWLEALSGVDPPVLNGDPGCDMF